MLVRLDAHFQVPPPDQRRDAHAIVVDQLQLAGVGDHHVGVLEVAVGDPRVDQLLGAPTQRSATVAMAWRLPSSDRARTHLKSVSPWTQSMRISGYHLPSPAERMLLVAVLELDQGFQLAALEILADQVVALAAFGRLGGEDPQREVAAGVGHHRLVDHGEGPGPGPRLVPLVLVDLAALQLRVAKSDPRVLQHRAEMGSQRPGHGCY